MKDQLWISSLQKQVTVVAVSKTRSRDEIESLYHRGITIFAENKVQELKQKARAGDLWSWHFIGHLQTNKVKDVISLCHMIHSVDSLRLLDKIASEALKLNKEVTILVQLKLTQEPSKFGLDPSELESFLERLHQHPHIHCVGMMVMGPLSDDLKETSATFEKAKLLFDQIKITHPLWHILSMGMSDDYLLALEYGSTMVRLGTLLFKD